MNRNESRPAISKCKRIVRPLTSKISSLTDLYFKYPSKFELDVEKCSTLMPTLGGRLKFANPGSSDLRLSDINKFLAPELAQAYVELFAIFKNVIFFFGDQRHSIPSLSEMSATKLGKTVVLGTKSTYFKLNQSSLFDQTSLPKYLQKYRSELTDDIDDWLCMEPTPVSATHRSLIMIGYVLHLIVFNLRNLLYPLVPVLVHWLSEKGYEDILRTLLAEFLLSLPSDPDQESVMELAYEYTQLSDPSLLLFWFFHSIGYWQPLVTMTKLTSLFCSLRKFSAYDAILLEILFRTNRLSISVLPNMNEIYDLLARNSQHPFNTQIITSIAAQLIFFLKQKLDSSKTSNASLDVIRSSLQDIRKLIQCWLPLNSKCIFNSLDGGNEDLFDAITDYLRYLASYCAKAIAYLNKRMKSTASTRIKDALVQYKNCHFQADTLMSLVYLLGTFYLDKNLPTTLSNLRINPLARTLVELMAEDAQLTEVLDLLLWLKDSKVPQHKSLLNALIKGFFKESSLLMEQSYDGELLKEYHLIT